MSDDATPAKVRLSAGLGPIARVVPYLYSPSVRLEWESTWAAHNARPGPLYAVPSVEHMAASLFEHIAHGDEKHRAWLQEQALTWARAYLGPNVELSGRTRSAPT